MRGLIQATTMRLAALALGMLAVTGSGAPAQTPAGAPPPGDAVASRATMPVLGAARLLELDMSSSEVRDTLRKAGFAVEMETDLPPDGLNRLVLAVPEEDDCIPRGAQFVCPAVRVVLLNDPQRGHRAVRIEAYEKVDASASVAEMFARVATAMGPPLQTEMVPEQVRGGAVVVWRQRWRDGLSDGALTEIFVTQDAPARPGFGLADPNEPATGVGILMADTESEGAFAAVRRRLRSGAPR